MAEPAEDVKPQIEESLDISEEDRKLVQANKALGIKPKLDDASE